MTESPRIRGWATAGAALLSLFALMAGQAWAPPETVPTVVSGSLAHARTAAGAPVPPGPGRVLAIGDIHGDFEALTVILRDIGLTDEENHWIGGETTLIQTGDFTDRGPDVRKVLDLLMRLQDEAAAQGGRLEVLLANHEGMNLVDFWRDNSPADCEGFVDDKSEERQAAAYDEYVAVAKGRAKALREDEPDLSGEARRIWLKEHPPGFVER